METLLPVVDFLRDAYIRGAIPGMPAPRNELEFDMGWPRVFDQWVQLWQMQPFFEDDIVSRRRRAAELRHQDRCIRSADITEFMNEIELTKEGCDPSWLEGTNALPTNKREPYKKEAFTKKSKKKKHRNKSRSRSSSFNLDSADQSFDTNSSKPSSETDETASLVSLGDLPALSETKESICGSEADLSTLGAAESICGSEADLSTLGAAAAQDNTSQPASQQGKKKKKKRNRSRSRSKGRKQPQLSVFPEAIDIGEGDVDPCRQNVTTQSESPKSTEANKVPAESYREPKVDTKFETIEAGKSKSDKKPKVRLTQEIVKNDGTKAKQSCTINKPKPKEQTSIDETSEVDIVRSKYSKSMLEKAKELGPFGVLALPDLSPTTEPEQHPSFTTPHKKTHKAREEILDSYMSCDPITLSQSTNDSWQSIIKNSGNGGARPKIRKDLPDTGTLSMEQSERTHQQQPTVKKVPGVRNTESKTQRNDFEITHALKFIKFPLEATHDFRIVCDECVGQTEKNGQFHLIDMTDVPHNCAKNELIVKKKTEKNWLKIRERLTSYTKYIRCKFFNARSASCKGDKCGFPHSEEELDLWTKEAHLKFNIHEFKTHYRNQETKSKPTTEDLLRDFPGFFTLICRCCFLSQPPMLMPQADDKGTCIRSHNWEANKLLCHVSKKGPVTVIGVMPLLWAFFMCPDKEFCQERWKENVPCRRAHSALERDVWIWQRITKASQEELVSSSIREATTPVDKPDEAATPTVESNRTESADSGVDQKVDQTSPGEQTQGAITPMEQENRTPDDIHFIKYKASPYPAIEEYCGKCLKTKIRSKQNPNHGLDRCVKGHSWSQHKCFYIPSHKKTIREFPGTCGKNVKYIMCWRVQNQGECKFYKPCHFAHFKEEQEIWNWMHDNGVRTLADIVTNQAPTAPRVVAPIKGFFPRSGTAWQTVPQNSGSVLSLRQIQEEQSQLPTASQSSHWLKTHKFYCVYCSKACNDQKQLDRHCASISHSFNVNSDQERNWNYRQPPWDVQSGNYQLCSHHAQDKQGCIYSHVPQDYNFCRFAHSDAELDEWKDRWNWRQMKRESSKNSLMYSYMDKLWEDYRDSQTDTDVLIEHLPGINITCQEQLNISSSDKQKKSVWLFKVESKENLHKVALLLTEGRSHFALLDAEESRKEQVLSADDIQREPIDKTYRVQVHFESTMFGSYRQWVVFDFGSKPAVVRKLSVSIATTEVQSELERIKEEVDFDRWSPHTKNIIRFKPESQLQDEFENQLLKKYPYPDMSLIDQDLVDRETTKENYKKKTHQLINLEEHARAGIVAKFISRARLEVSQLITEHGVFENAPPGHLFGRVPLEDGLSTDSAAGRVILMSVNKALLRKVGDESNNAYEAEIVIRDRFDGRTEKFIYVLLSSRCIADYSLADKETVDIEIQFQMDRLPFCKMHFAIDRLTNMNIVFPDVTNIQEPEWQTEKKFEISSDHLNESQLKVVREILKQKPGATLPVICYGPFGTGKTETLAQAVMIIAKEQKGHVLLCTHSNSAADLYIKRFLHEYQQRTPVKILRDYHTNRSIYTIPEVVRDYCKLSGDKRQLLVPTPEELFDHDIVITTVANAAHYLQHENLHGSFTHILVDEAAQVLESEIVIPFALASEQTVMVLAGDHVQTRPEVFNAAARQQQFDRSILERLFTRYAALETHGYKTACLSNLLKTNYRTHQEILRFLALVFYGGPENLICGKKHRSVPGRHAIAFYCAQGSEVQDTTTTSFYNDAEVDEIVTRVYELAQEWPDHWGNFDPQKIGVVSPYHQQILKIRDALRRKGLAQVNVGPMASMQGLEFTALFISTVRTRHAQVNLDDDDLNLGFLSDRHMLNTALTRAESFVGVVGDPVALCSMGECAVIWRAFMTHCQNHNSIYPEQLTIESITLEIKMHQDQQSSRGKSTSMAKNYFRAASFCWDDDASLPADDIIRQLAKEAQKASDKPLTPDGTSSATNEPLKLEYIRITESENQAVLSYSPPPSWPDTRQKRHLLGADDWDKDFDSDDENQRSDLQDSEWDYNEQQLLDMIKHDPGRYKRCILHIQSSFRIRAHVCALDDSEREICIANRKRCGRAFDQDEVVVKILPRDEEEIQLRTVPGDDLPSGEVIGVLNRAIDPRYRKFVCIIDEGYGMIPLNKGYHRMVCLKPSHYADRSKKGNTVSVYKFNSDKTLKFDHSEVIHPSDFKQKLFVVRFLKWDQKFHSPLCMVIGTLPQGISIDEGIDILNLEYFVPKDFKSTTSDQAKHIKKTFSTKKLTNRVQFQKQLCITIDPDTSKDLDDALSIEELPRGVSRIGVHIADVSHFVQKDTDIDQEAQARGVTYYPSGSKPIPMLPTELSNDVCSLIPDEERLTLSLFITIDQHCNILEKEVKQSIIKSRHRLTYQDAEDIIEGHDSGDEELQRCVMRLHSVSQTWRKSRLGNEALFHFLDPDSASSPKAHLLVQEMMIMANREVTEILLEHYPRCTPLRVDLPPDEDELDDWKRKFREVAQNTVALRQPFLQQNERCLCSKECSCLDSTPRQPKLVTRTAALDFIMDNIDDTNLEYFIADPKNIPEAENALIQLYRLKTKASYVCSGDHPQKNWRHNSLNMKHYTHFTSPIRRYVDVVVHRLLTCIAQNQSCPYTREELSAICASCSQAGQRANQYQSASERLHLATALQKKPVVMYPTVEAVSDSSIQLRTPGVKCIQTRQNEVKMPALQPAKQPEYNEETDTVEIKWHDRIYVKDLPEESRPHSQDSQYMPLNQSRFVVQIDTEKWQNLLAELRSGSKEAIQRACHAVQSSVIQMNNDDTGIHSEVCSIAHSNQNCRYSLALHPADVVKTQMSAEVSRGILSPRLQLLELTSEISICLEHRTNPVECFANSKPRHASKIRYDSIEEYKKLWLNLVEIESAKSAIHDGDCLVIQKVDIRWFSNDSWIEGRFELDAGFCEDRNITFGASAGKEDDDVMDEDEDESTTREEMLDYFCIQYHNVPNTAAAGADLEKKFDLDFSHPTTWVGHCLSTEVKPVKKRNTIQVKLKLLPSPVKTPDFHQLNKMRANVEFIMKSLPKRREEAALYSIGSRSKLAESIALGHKTPELSKAHVEQARLCAKKTVHGLQPANGPQQAAVEKAMTSSFTLIQGPPGTGKTVTGVRLANLFADFNSVHLTDGQTRPQVMYCGPSNKAVDVVAEYIFRQGITAPKIVRVYGSLIEKEDFPMPRDTFTPNKKKTTYSRNKALEKVTLHYMIRNRADCTLALQIHEMDELREKCITDKHDMTRDDKKQYKELLREAKTEVLQKADIILCTCNTSSGNVLEIVNIKQVIIDECGMCTEPEAMIPIVACRPEQVVLIGDHKQLSPVVIDDRAGKLGLEVSLFERYSRKAHMLTTQYRMHEAIADFPSKQFYEDRLVCGTPQQRMDSPLDIWPNGRNKPIAFVHLVGREESLKVSTDEGSEQSKKNDKEAAKAALLAFHLKHNKGVAQKNILILSQYRAQCALIKQYLQGRGLGEVNVSTVVAAQGSECDYVILSTVRSMPKSLVDHKPTKGWFRRNLGFITDQNQINVALTRAKRGLVIIGNRHLLVSHPMWAKLLESYRQQRKLVDSEKFCR